MKTQNTNYKWTDSEEEIERQMNKGIKEDLFSIRVALVIIAAGVILFNCL